MNKNRDVEIVKMLRHIAEWPEDMTTSDVKRELLRIASALEEDKDYQMPKLRTVNERGVIVKEQPPS